MNEDAKTLRQQIEDGLASGLDAAILLVLFRSYADTMQARLETIKEELVCLDALSLTDALTGIQNRRALDRRLTEEIADLRGVAPDVSLDEHRVLGVARGRGPAESAEDRLGQLPRL